MDINNNQQQNTFESGMNTDTADYVLAKNQYRSSRNVRLVANKGNNSAELHLIDGNSLSFTLDDLDIDNNWKILAVNSCRNIGIIIAQTINKWNIIKITVNDDSIDRDFVFRDGIFTLLNETCVDTVLRYESSENIKLYIADSSNPLLVVNIATTRQDLTFDDIYSYPQALLNAPLFDSIGDDGTLAAGLYQYAYMLYNKNGLSTEMSRTTKLIPLVNSVGNGWYDGYEKGTGNKSIHIQINVGDTKLQKILIYRIKYVENGQMPLIELIADQDIFGSTINFIDSGQSALSTLTVEEFNSTSGVHIIPKCIESKYDYLFAAGIKQQDVDLVDVPDFDTRTYSYRNDGGDTYSAIIDGVRVGTFSTTDDPSTIKTAISNLDDISTTADCIQTSDCKYCPMPDDAYVSGKCKMMYGGIGKNIRWQFIKTSLDADYTNAHRYYDNISHLRDNDRLRDETYMGGKQGCAYDAIHQAFYGDGS